MKLNHTQVCIGSLITPRLSLSHSALEKREEPERRVPSLAFTTRMTNEWHNALLHHVSGELSVTFARSLAPPNRSSWFLSRLSFFPSFLLLLLLPFLFPIAASSSRHSPPFLLTSQFINMGSDSAPLEPLQVPLILQPHLPRLIAQRETTLLMKEAVWSLVSGEHFFSYDTGSCR